MPLFLKLMSEREFSDLKLSRVECEHCGAVWINGQHRWKTGNTSENSEVDLAGLVCNTPYGNPTLCKNPAKGKEGGDTWERRLAEIDRLLKETET